MTNALEVLYLYMDTSDTKKKGKLDLDKLFGSGIYRVSRETYDSLKNYDGDLTKLVNVVSKEEALEIVSIKTLEKNHEAYERLSK